MEYRILGSIEVLDSSGRKLPLGGAMQQSVLASLLLRAGQTVVLDHLVDELWDEPPVTAARTVQAYVSRLRHELPKRAIESRPGGYVLLLDGGELDLETFGRRAEEGHAALAAGDHEQAASLLREALALWRGPALAGLTSEALRRQAERLEELRVSALEDRIEADLESARHSEIVPELTALVAEHPFRERLRAQLMRALFRSGRPGEALALYRETRRLLVEELGMEPGQQLRELEQAILRQDAALEAPELKRPVLPVDPVASKRPVAEAPPRQARKTVTVLFCALVGSTALNEAADPEALQALLARYFDRMRMIVEHHGGTVEKFIGEAVMAVFGVPFAHEDDALRACRAALEMRESFGELGVEGRIGVTTGEVVTGMEERLATGDAVNVAARLQQASRPGEVLLGEPTLQLVHEAVEAEALEPLALKGKEQAVVAYRLLAAHGVPERRHDQRFVGREQELALVREAWERVLKQQTCELVTIVGEAGVGKSRLVAEALAPIDARIVYGRCLPYGKGITYWPVVEVIRQLHVLPSDATASETISSVLRKSDAGPSADEIAWAFRRLLEEVAPLIVVFDDIQWGEETFVDLLEHLALLSSGAPLLLLGMARRDLVERRPTWPVAIRLEPLPAAAVAELLGADMPPQLATRISQAAGGNPLFISEMLAMAGQRASEVTVPPNLWALLAARLDQLSPAERTVLEAGAVEGKLFHRGAVQALVPPEIPITPRLAALVRKGLIRPTRSQVEGEDGFRFRHLLIRDAAYAGLPKATRADLHQRFAAWLEQRGTDLVELDELLGYHLEQAWRYRAELGTTDDGFLAAAARRRLSAGGYRAALLQDYSAAASLLERAVALVPPPEIDLALESKLVDALILAGESANALRRAGSIVERASAAGDLVAELCGRVKEANLRCYREPEGATEQLAALLDEAMPVFQAAKDDLALYIGCDALVTVALEHSQMGKALEAWERAAAHARQAGVPYEQRSLLLGAGARLVGTTPVPELLAWLDEQEAHAMLSPYVRSHRAQALAMLGRFDEARAILTETRAELAERGGVLWLAVMIGDTCVDVELLAGDPTAAVEFGEEGFRLLEELGEKSAQSYVAGTLAQALYALDRFVEAEAWVGRAAELGASDDALTQTLWRQVRAKVLARRGEHAEAELLAREAVAIGDNTDLLDMQGDAYADLAEVLALGGSSDAAAEALEQALERYERKENLIMAERASGRLAELRASASAQRR